MFAEERRRQIDLCGIGFLWFLINIRNSQFVIALIKLLKNRFQLCNGLCGSGCCPGNVEMENGSWLRRLEAAMRMVPFHLGIFAHDYTPVSCYTPCNFTRAIGAYERCAANLLVVAYNTKGQGN